MNRAIRNIVFDFDGTLADTVQTVQRAFEETLVELDHRKPPREPDSIPDGLFSRTLPDMFRALGVTRPKEIDRAIRRYNRRYRELSPKRSALFPEVPETLTDLRDSGFSMAIATHERRENLDILLPAFGIADLFEYTLCEDEVVRTKPDPEMLTTLMKRLGAEPSETLMVGDSILDMEMGKRAGCRTCGAVYGTPSGERLNAASPDHLIRRPRELIGIVAPTASIERESNGHGPPAPRSRPDE